MVPLGQYYRRRGRRCRCRYGHLDDLSGRLAAQRGPALLLLGAPASTGLVRRSVPGWVELSPAL